MKQNVDNSSFRARCILQKLKECYPVTGPFTNWSTPLELVIATMLSAQCTDSRVNMVTPELFAKYPTAKACAAASLTDIEKIIYSVGFYRAKAKYIKGIGEIIVHEFSGEVPDDLESLLRLPGISKKSAYIILAKAFKKFVGVPVDTHVLRTAPRLGLTQSTNRDIQARDLEALFPPSDYLAINEYLITLGRDVCIPRKPKCGECALKEICEF